MDQMVPTNTSVSVFYIMNIMQTLGSYSVFLVISTQVLGCILSFQPKLGHMLILKAITMGRQMEYSFGKYNPGKLWEQVWGMDKFLKEKSEVQSMREGMNEC